MINTLSVTCCVALRVFPAMKFQDFTMFLGVGLFYSQAYTLDGFAI